MTPETFEAAVSFYSERLDKSYSFVDCSSMSIMRQGGIRRALTTDHHFRQERFAGLMID